MTSSDSRFGPRDEYARRIADRQHEAERLGRRERLTGNGRLLVFLAGLGLAWFVFGTPVLSAWWLLVPAVLFSTVLVLHDRVTRAWYRARRAVAFYQRGLARLDDDWRGSGQPGTRYVDEQHPNAADLDLFGPGSLFELLCTARTRTGEDTLAGWLKAPANPDEVRSRQAAVAELRPLLDLREDLALLGAEVPAGIDFGAVVAWGAAPPVLTHRWTYPTALVLGLGALVTALGGLFSDWGSTPFLIAVVASTSFAGWIRPRVDRVLRSVEKRAYDLALLANVLARLEREHFTSHRLSSLRAVLDPASGRLPPSQRIAQLGNLIDVLNSRKNQLFAPFAYLMLWGTQMAHRIERWRLRNGPAVSKWLDVVGQFEALSALATYAYENPDDPFPDVVAEGARYDGEGLAHPLMPRGQCVPNDLRLTDGRRLLVVSGSNMSGKSTFLRTVGINAVLALAGGPVRARRLTLSPLAIGATLRIQDSLQAGRSRFYAELLRVRQVVDLSRGSIPLLFLLDEIFAGTNSHDRRIGAEAVVCGLVESGAIGLITTHDLTLTRIVDRLGERALNVHFADHLEDGVMRFDYRLHSGVVQHSNALELMRAVGLRV